MGNIRHFSWQVFSFLFVTILAFISDWLQKTMEIPFPAGFRHLIILFLFVFNWTLYKNKLFAIPKIYKYGIIVMGLFLFFGYFSSPASLFNYLIGILFTFLFLGMFLLGLNTKIRAENMTKIFKLLIIFILIGSIDPISKGLIQGTNIQHFFGYFRELGAFGAAMNIGSILCLSLYIITKKKVYIFVALFFSIGVFMTILKKNIVSNVIVWIFFFLFQPIRNKKLKLISFVSIIFIAGFLLVGNSLIENLVFNVQYLENVGIEGHVRLGMYLASYNIAIDYFPFGSGPGTFGSLSSIIGWYSSIYFDYGVSNIGANSPEEVAIGIHTLLDTFWPHILGELGFIGTLIYVCLWLFPLKLAFKLLRQTNDSFIKGLSFYVFSVIIVMAWEGFTLYTPEIPSFIILHSGLVGLCYFHLRKVVNNDINYL